MLLTPALRVSRVCELKLARQHRHGPEGDTCCWTRSTQLGSVNLQPSETALLASGGKVALLQHLAGCWQ